MSERTPTRLVSRWRLTRREVLKAGPAVGLGACALGLGLLGQGCQKTRTAAGVCRVCTAHCGLVATVKGERLVRVEGDPKSATRGFVCQHALALPELVHAGERLRRPLRREGNELREVAWPRALAEIAGRLQEVKKKHGAQALAVHTGWPLVRHPINNLLHRLCHAFGTPNFSSVASQCEAARRMGKALTVGADYFPDMAGVKTLVLWGANPAVTNPLFAHQVAEKASGEGRALVVIDPVRHDTAARATLHLQVLPGTDAALALGMIRLLLEEGRHDQAVATEQSVGLAELRAAAEPWTLERTAEVTTVPAGLIARAARLMAGQGPTGIWDGLGLQHHRHGLQTQRAVAALQALLGSVEVPGGVKLFNRAGKRFGQEPLPALFRMRTQVPAPPPPARPAIGWAEYPLFDVFNRQAQANLYPRAMLEGRPYPLRALVLFGSNPLLTWPGTRRLREAFGRLELLVSVDPFLTETGEIADFVLPAATFAESREATAPNEQRSSLVPEQHEAWPDWKIAFELARALGLEELFPWESLSRALKGPYQRWMDDAARQPTPQVSQAPRFPTMSGKLELKSSLMERFGKQAVPSFEPPPVQPGPEFPLWLVTGARTRAYLNSQFHRCHSLAQTEPEPFVELHPGAARAAGVADGQKVAVVSPHGRIEIRVRVDDRVHPKVALVPLGWAKANANELTDGEALDPVSGFPAFRSSVCRIERAG